MINPHLIGIDNNKNDVFLVFVYNDFEYVVNKSFILVRHC